MSEQNDADAAEIQELREALTLAKAAVGHTSDVLARAVPDAEARAALWRAHWAEQVDLLLRPAGQAAPDHWCGSKYCPGRHDYPHDQGFTTWCGGDPCRPPKPTPPPPEDETPEAMAAHASLHRWDGLR